jgi:F-type H+-transporting ATPase subunit gamma
MINMHFGLQNQLQNSSENVKIVCVGDKSRGLLQRLFSNNIMFVAKEIGRKPPQFSVFNE